jgi:hypothetical protein
MDNRTFEERYVKAKIKKDLSSVITITIGGEKESDEVITYIERDIWNSDQDTFRNYVEDRIGSPFKWIQEVKR